MCIVYTLTFYFLMTTDETILYICTYHKQGSEDSMGNIVVRFAREQFVRYLYMANEMLGGSTWLELGGREHPPIVSRYNH